MALAYGLDAPALLRKRPDGRLSLPGKILFGPVILLNRLILLGHRLSVREPLMDEIAPNLFPGGRPWRFDAAALHRRGIRSVADLTAEFSETPDARPGRLDELERAVAWIERERRAGPVLVHCAPGHGRSAMAASSCLIHDGTASGAETALGQIRERRPRIELRPEQAALPETYATHRRSRVTEEGLGPGGSEK